MSASYNKINNSTLIIMVVLFLCTSAFNIAKAQDQSFSQFHVTPFMVNPSYIGKDVVDWRVAMNLRSHSVGGIDLGSFNTTSISLEKNVFANTDKTSQLGIGVMMLKNGGGDEVLKNNYLGFAVSYNIQLTENSSIGLGLSAHQTNRIIDLSTIRFESQFGSDGFQNSIPSGEYNYLPSSNFWSLNQGINYTYYQPRWGYTLGAAYFNSNKPLDGFFAQNKYPIKTRVIYQSKLWFALGGYEVDKSIHLTHLSEYQGSQEWHTIGAIYKQGFSNMDLIKSVNIGFYNRFNDKYYPYLGIETNKWIAGLSYDISQANKSVASSMRSLELSFVLQLSGIKAKDNRISNDPVMAY
jgi:type IX secretion system PorP/SprF family membrane protein